jgi:hypothetical protein
MQYGGEGIWDKLKAGGYPDVSMGTKVPFDTCSITLDRRLYQKAWDTYDPKHHRSPGEAILEYHKKLKARDGIGIRGLSITRNDYSDYARTQMNRILPDGRKVWVDNDFPKFFDISFVFIGADKIAKAMLKIAEGGRVYSFIGSAELAEKLGAVDLFLEKTAAIPQSEILKYEPKETGTSRIATFDDLHEWMKRADIKAAMTKDVVPNQLAGKAVPLLTEQEPDLPTGLLQVLGDAGLGTALSTTAGLGMVLRPREFQRVTLISLGKGDLAGQLDSLGQVFPKTDESSDSPLDTQSFSPSLAQLLEPLMADRSAFGPIIERRVVVITGAPLKSSKKASSHSSELLRKIGSAYNGYRNSLMQFVSNSQDLIEAAAPVGDVVLHKLASTTAEELFTPLSYQYLSSAFLNELPVAADGIFEVKLSSQRAEAGVQRELPLVTTRKTNRHQIS